MPTKQVIVVNEELRLPRGKLAAQVAHASLASFLAAGPGARQEWMNEGMPKVVFACPSLAQMLELQRRARSAHLPVALIEDAGRTVVPAGTATCLGIGPSSAQAIDAITGALPLVR
ncbi:MAG: aminoacyl-tRNA hydrolase [Betaproteobacteria bacterium HGW-Betaproteobacteria-12]|nr:MAG: aminoacyl-tRNA hydrolase [Betaproteobacteria bacterium HGW-Betaproteobacteria-12]